MYAIPKLGQKRCLSRARLALPGLLVFHHPKVLLKCASEPEHAPLADWFPQARPAKPVWGYALGRFFLLMIHVPLMGRSGHYA
jgi:hypothetical protein